MRGKIFRFFFAFLHLYVRLALFSNVFLLLQYELELMHANWIFDFFFKEFFSFWWMNCRKLSNEVKNRWMMMMMKEVNTKVRQIREIFIEWFAKGLKMLLGLFRSLLWYLYVLMMNGALILKSFVDFWIRRYFMFCGFWLTEVIELT